MKTLGYIFLFLICIIVVIFLFGVFTPSEYQGEIQRNFADCSVENLYNMLTDPRTSASRKSEIVEVEILGDWENGLTIWRESARFGGYTTYEFLELVPYGRVVVDMKRSSFGMSGNFTYTLQQATDNCWVKIEERSVVSRPMIRATLVFIGRKSNLKNEMRGIEIGLNQIKDK